MSSSLALASGKNEKPKAAIIGPPCEADGCRSGDTASRTMTDTADIPLSRLKRLPALEPSSLNQPDLQDTMAMLGREYEFFVTTEEPHQPEGTDRGLIRRLVMRNFFETKGAGAENSTSAHNSASTVMAKQQLKSRFRLSKIGQESPRTKNKGRNGKEEPVKAKRKRPKASRTLSSSTKGSEFTEGDTSMAGSPSISPGTEEASATGKSKDNRRSQSTLSKIDLGAHRFDPFDVLPVPGTPQLDMLFKLCMLSSHNTEHHVLD